MKEKIWLITLLITLNINHGFSQITQQEMPKLKQKLQLATSDTDKVKMLLTISSGYRFSNIDSALYYDDQGLSLSRKSGWVKGEARSLSDKGSIFLESGDIPNALKYMLAAQNIVNKVPDANSRILNLASIENRIGNIYMELGEYKTSLFHYQVSFKLASKVRSGLVENEISNIGNVYEMMGLTDSAKIYLQKIEIKPSKEEREDHLFVWSELRQRLGNLEIDLGHNNAAINQYRLGILDASATHDLRNLSVLYLKMGILYKRLNTFDSSFFYARKAIETSRQVLMKRSIYEATDLLSSLFELKHEPDSALFYAKLSANVKDELYGPKIFRQLELITLKEQQRQQQLQEQNSELRYKYTIIGTGSGLGVILLIVIIIWRNYRKQKESNLLLNQQKKEIETQRDNLGHALEELKNTQTQLVHREKMASLGELTAGIAHEIQNPLNFVNNFSEVNEEMLEELKAENKKAKTDRNEKLESELIDVLIEN